VTQSHGPQQDSKSIPYFLFPNPYLFTHIIRDLRIEWRSKDAINAMLFFALIIVVLFSLAFDPTREVSRQIAGGILCVATMFASITALNQTWSRELRNNVLDAQRMSPAPASSLFLAKVLVNFFFVSVVQAILAPLFVIFYNLRSVGPAWPLLLVIPLGTWALIVNGTFFAALSIRTRNRELLLPLILFPIYIPALLAMVLATTDILTGESDPVLWIKFLAGYDVIFTTVSLLLFATVIHAE
jgi:heme exporter protein B